MTKLEASGLNRIFHTEGASMSAIRWGLLLLLLVPGLLSAQLANVGGIAGTVRDPAGAVVPKALVVAVNQGTAARQETRTDTSGGYIFTLLPIGNYTVTVTQPGFATEVHTSVPVISGQSFTVDFQLVVGKVTETVSVTEGSLAVDTTTVNMGTTRTLEELKQLPVGIAGSGSREASGFLKTIAGVAQVGYGPDWMQLSRGAVNGTPGVFFGYMIDGVDAAAGESETGEDFIAPTPDTVQETRITQNTDTSVGFNGGVASEFTMKSGTNIPHGSYYYYGENDYLNATNWFGKKVDRSRENEMGFTVGGPVYIPHVYDGRNKTFFFTSIDVYREAVAATQIATIPTTLMRGGNFTEVLGPHVGTDNLGRPIFQNEVYDPTTTRVATAGQVDPTTGLLATGSGPVRDPFNFGGQLNVIDPARLSKVSKFFQNGYLPPTSSGIFNNWTGNAVPPGDTFKDQWLLKIDQNIGDRHRLYFSWESVVPWFLGSSKGTIAGLSGHSSSQNSSGFLTAVDSSTFVDDRSQYRIRFNYVYTISPTLIFNFSTGMTRDPKRNQAQVPATGPEYTASADAGLTGTLNPMTPWTQIQGYGNVDGFGPRFGPGQQIHSQRNVFRLGWTWSKSKHLMKFGSDFEILPYIYVDNTQTNGIAGFANGDTGLPGFTTSSTGWGWASFLLGAANSMQVGTKIENKFTSGGTALYAQDTWRLSPRLTLNYGLRWDIYMPGHMTGNQLSTFDPGAANPAAGGIPGALTFYGVGPGRDGLTTVSDYYFKALAPKVGFAYAYDRKTVFRANFGISYYPFWTKFIGSGGTLISQQGFQSIVNVNESSTGGLFPAFYWDKGFPGVFPPLPNLDPSQLNGGNAQWVDHSQNRPPMGENIGVQIERELPKQFVVNIGYVGTLGHRLPLNGPNLNVIPLSDISLGNLLFDNINSPQAIAAGIKSPYAGFNGSVSQALAKYPQYASVSKLSDQWGSSAYNALQVNVQRHFGSLTMLANYTFSKWLTDGNYYGYLGYGGANSYQHPDFKSREAKQLSSLNRPQVVNLSWVYELPVGKGKRIYGSAGGVVDRIVGGWRLSAIQTYQAGTPLSVGGTAGIPGVGGVWVNRNPGVPLALSSCGNLNPRGSNNRILNVAAFSEPAPFTFGNTSQLQTVRSCYSAEEDLSFDKSVTITEKSRFHIGMIFNNAFNRHYWTGIDTGIADPGFGTVSGASPPRTVQYYGRIEF
jgi:hypothetical protein